MERIKKAWNRGVEVWREQFQWIEKIWSETIFVPRANRSMFGVKQPEGLEKIFLIILQFFRCLSLRNVIYSADKKKWNSYTEIYVIAWLGFLILLLIFYPVSPIFYSIVAIILVLVPLIFFVFAFSSLILYRIVAIFLLLLLLIIVNCQWLNTFWLILLIVGYQLVDILSANLGIIFIDRYKNGSIRSLNRSLLLIGINYFEVIVAFAILYLATSSIGYTNCNNILTSPIDALYFSAVTITSLGCYDLMPISSWGKVLVALEPIIGLILIVIVIGAFFTFYSRKD